MVLRISETTGFAQRFLVFIRRGVNGYKQLDRQRMELHWRQRTQRGFVELGDVVSAELHIGDLSAPPGVTL